MFRFMMILVFVCAGSAIPVCAQDCSKKVPADLPSKPRLENPIDLSNYEGWEWVVIEGRLKFMVPPGFKRHTGPGTKESQDIDDIGVEFLSDEFRLFVEFGSAAYVPSGFTQELPNFCAEYLWHNGAWTFQWNIRPGGSQRKWESGVYFQFKEHRNYRIGVYLFSDKRNTKEIATKMFRSIEFIPRTELKLPADLKTTNKPRGNC